MIRQLRMIKETVNEFQNWSHSAAFAYAPQNKERSLEGSPTARKMSPDKIFIQKIPANALNAKRLVIGIMTTMQTSHFLLNLYRLISPYALEHKITTSLQLAKTHHVQ